MSEFDAARGPLVTVLLPCYNAEAYLDATLQSLRQQTYPNLEILAIDDGSTDGTAAILAAAAAQDPRVRLCPNQGNQGLIRTLNRGLDLANGELIARMDADDIAVPQRIARQVAYFKEHPDTDVLCSDVTYIDQHGAFLSDPYPYRFNERVLRFFSFFLNPLCHPTVMGRRDVLRACRYSEDAPHSEDFELWLRMIHEGRVLRNLPERLLRFRCAAGSVSHRHAEQQIATFMNFTREAIQAYYGITVSESVQRILLNRMIPGEVRGTDLRQALDCFRDMFDNYVERERLGPADRRLLRDFADRHLANVLLHAYKRSSSEDPARWIAVSNTLPLCGRRTGWSALAGTMIERLRR